MTPTSPASSDMRSSSMFPFPVRANTPGLLQDPQSALSPCAFFPRHRHCTIFHHLQAAPQPPICEPDRHRPGYRCPHSHKTIQYVLILHPCISLTATAYLLPRIENDVCFSVTACFQQEVDLLLLLSLCGVQDKKRVRSRHQE